MARVDSTGGEGSDERALAALRGSIKSVGGKGPIEEALVALSDSINSLEDYRKELESRLAGALGMADSMRSATLEPEDESGAASPVAVELRELRSIVDHNLMEFRSLIDRIEL